MLVVFDPSVTSYETLLKVFWEGHDPTQGMRQGNDVGTQYRSAIYTTTTGAAEARRPVADRFQAALTAARHGEITTEIRARPTFYYAEAYHQQYLAKVPNGYCGLGGTGVSCPVGRQPAVGRQRRHRRLIGSAGGRPRPSPGPVR